MSAIVLLFAQTHGSPFLGSGIRTDCFHSVGNIVEFQIKLKILVSVATPVSPSCLYEFDWHIIYSRGFIVGNGFKCPFNFLLYKPRFSFKFAIQKLSLIEGSHLYRFFVYSFHCCFTLSISLKSSFF